MPESHAKGHGAAVYSSDDDRGQILGDICSLDLKGHPIKTSTVAMI